LIYVDKIVISKGITQRFIESDIDERNVDVIVDSTNSFLIPGGEVAGAIVRKGGKKIQEESDEIRFITRNKRYNL
jgi:O-acetyl-ADP-ribose deacetylase (regulator of RNase III)